MYSEDIKSMYGGRIRIRVCGILRHESSYLLVNHTQMNDDNLFWNFPGGGVESHETLAGALRREFKEEANLEITVGSFWFMNQVISGPIHAIELYFEVFTENFGAKIGHDPELNIINNLRWMNSDEILQLPGGHKPSFFVNLKSINDLKFRNQA